jgi:ankyrin repeat protein
VAPVKGDPDLIAALLNKGADPDAQNDRGVTALMQGAMVGNRAAVERLLDAGARVDVQDAEGRSALHYAAASGQVEVVELLVNRGADTRLRTKEGNTALMEAHRDVHSTNSFTTPERAEAVAQLLRRAREQ